MTRGGTRNMDTAGATLQDGRSTGRQAKFKFFTRQILVGKEGILWENRPLQTFTGLS